ncbi:MAG TPA: SemiSWEET family transporter [Gammaproteobacteria bacterium]|jgi:MtN3 and saliva related transmembrane protein|nr:SemiSWEET family transporter [Gammaproteobacteria bacterium]
MNEVQNIFGVIALVTSFIGLLPQSYKAFKTRSTLDISMLMLVNYVICSLAWIIYGWEIQASFVIASNVVGLISALILILQKNWYDKRAVQHAQ